VKKLINQNDKLNEELINTIEANFVFEKKPINRFSAVKKESDISQRNKQNLLEKRSIKRVLGNFEESISPNMIQKILTWLKKKDKDKYGRIKRGIKEEIIIELSKCGITINPEFLCEFIDNNNPMNFIKEWKIKPYINGKRMKNTEIRKLFKEAFYKRERDCVRFKIISPSLNSLPQNIETMIISYL